MIGIIGKKIGMTQFFKEDGTRISVTLIGAGPCPILQVKNAKRDGYIALQLGFDNKRESLLNRAVKGHLKKSGVKSIKTIKEVRFDSAGNYKEGQLIDVDLFEPGDFVDVTGISIGKGFQGGMKRWNWTGGKASHGSMHHRRVGSIGASSFPSRVHKGKNMPGRMGGVQRTIQNLEVIKVDKEKHLIAIKGSVPGNENSYLLIKVSKKKPKALKAETKKAEEPKKEEAKKQEPKKEVKDKKPSDEKAKK